MPETLQIRKEMADEQLRFGHFLLNPVSTARDYHLSNFIPDGGWDKLKVQFQEGSQGNARPESFTDQFGIRTLVSTFIGHGLRANWDVKSEVLNLDTEGNEIVDFMAEKMKENPSG